MNVRELIAALEALPDRVKDRPVVGSGCDCWSNVTSVKASPFPAEHGIAELWDGAPFVLIARDSDEPYDDDA